MNFILTDVSIFIFLSRLELMESFIGMDFIVHTTNFIMNDYNRGRKQDNSLKNFDKYIRSGKISEHVCECDAIQSVYNRRQGISPSDCSAYILYQKLGSQLLTGDRTLQVFSDQLGIRIYDIIWLMDEMYKHAIIDEIEYKEKLTELKSLSCRLPVEEINRRLN